MAAASMTISPARQAVIDFTEPYMTLHTTVLIKKSPATDAAITSVEDLVGQSEVKYGLMKDGITEDFFKYTSNAVYRQIWRTIQVCHVGFQIMVRPVDVAKLCLYVYVPVCLYVCLSVCMHVCLSMCVSVYMSVCMFVCMYVCMSTRVSVCLSTRLSVCLAGWLSVCLSPLLVYLPVCISACLSI